MKCDFVTGKTRQVGLVALLLAPLAFFCGCGADLPPGGKPAVQYWHRVLEEYPDLPAKVQAIVDSQGWQGQSHGLASTEVRIYTDHGEVTANGSQIELIVTDMDTPDLRKLLDLWKAIPGQAAEMGLTSGSTVPSWFKGRKVIVLGSEGRIDIRGVSDQNTQSIRILSDEATATAAIGIHTFGPSGDVAVEELARNYDAVRGPPSSEVRSGHISLPPPGLSILVIGKLKTLNIEGPSNDASQQLSLAAFLNGHGGDVLGYGDELAGRPAGAPFEERLAAIMAAARQSEYATPVAAEPALSESSSSSSYGSSSGSYSSGNNNTVASPASVQLPNPITLPVTPPITPPWTPPQQFQPPVIVTPPVVQPPMNFTPPVRFH